MNKQNSKKRKYEEISKDEEETKEIMTKNIKKLKLQDNNK